MLLLTVGALSMAVQGQVPETAFELALHVEPHGSPIVPAMEEPVNLTFTGEVTCVAGSPPRVQPVSVDLSVSVNESWASAVVSPAAVSVVFEAAECVAGATKTWNGSVEIRVHEDAPGLTPFLVVLSAAAGDASTTQIWSESVAPVMRTSAMFEQTAFHTNSGLVQIPLLLNNRGNMPVIVRTEVGDLTSEALEMSVPGAIPVKAFTGTAQATVEVRVPATVGSERYAAWIRVLPEAEGQPTVPGTPLTLNALIQTSVLSGSGPAATVFVAFVAIVALLTVFFWRRR